MGMVRRSRGGGPDSIPLLDFPYKHLAIRPLVPVFAALSPGCLSEGIKNIIPMARPQLKAGNVRVDRPLTAWVQCPGSALGRSRVL